jgi:hypothetical protein
MKELVATPLEAKGKKWRVARGSSPGVFALAQKGKWTPLDDHHFRVTTAHGDLLARLLGSEPFWRTITNTGFVRSVKRDVTLSNGGVDTVAVFGAFVSKGGEGILLMEWVEGLRPLLNGWEDDTAMAREPEENKELALLMGTTVAKVHKLGFDLIDWASYFYASPISRRKLLLAGSEKLITLSKWSRKKGLKRLVETLKKSDHPAGAHIKELLEGYQRVAVVSGENVDKILKGLV